METLDSKIFIAPMLEKLKKELDDVTAKVFGSAVIENNELHFLRGKARSLSDSAMIIESVVKEWDDKFRAADDSIVTVESDSTPVSA